MRRVRTTNPVERGVQPELKWGTRLVQVFPNVAAVERLLTAILVEIDEEWAMSTQPCINWRTAPFSPMETENDDNERV